MIISDNKLDTQSGVHDTYPEKDVEVSRVLIAQNLSCLPVDGASDTLDVFEKFVVGYLGTQIQQGMRVGSGTRSHGTRQNEFQKIYCTKCTEKRNKQACSGGVAKRNYIDLAYRAFLSSLN